MDKTFTKTRYRLQSVKTGKIFEDEGWMLDAPGENEPSLLRAIYEKSNLKSKTIHGDFISFLTGCRF